MQWRVRKWVVGSMFCFHMYVGGTDSFRIQHTTGWPRSLGIYVIQPPSGQGNDTDTQAGGGSGMVSDYKTDVCEFYKDHGIWQPFWWAD